MQEHEDGGFSHIIHIPNQFDDKQQQNLLKNWHLLWN